MVARMEEMELQVHLGRKKELQAEEGLRTAREHLTAAQEAVPTEVLLP